MSAKAGQCLCGSVKFTAAKTGNFGVCHCKMCQRWAGSALFGVSVKAADMAVTGTEHIKTYTSSSWATRSHCTNCGSPLWYRYEPKGDGGGTYEVPVGLFDDANGFNLQREINIDVKPDSFDVAGDHERLTEAETMALFGISSS